jgi:hypothetical protein
MARFLVKYRDNFTLFYQTDRFSYTLSGGPSVVLFEFLYTRSEDMFRNMMPIFYPLATSSISKTTLQILTKISTGILRVVTRI